MNTLVNCPKCRARVWVKTSTKKNKAWTCPFCLSRHKRLSRQMVKQERKYMPALELGTCNDCGALYQCLKPKGVAPEKCFHCGSGDITFTKVRYQKCPTTPSNARDAG